MSRHRFYAQPNQIDGSTVTLSAEETHHLVRVLRLGRGDEVYVFDGLGGEYRCQVKSVIGRIARLQIIERLGDAVEPPLQVTLAQALTKGEKFDLIVQKATELGASRIVPLVTDRADLRLSPEPAQRRLARWRRISLEALKQCGRRRLVEITEPVELEEFLAQAGQFALVLSQCGQTIRSALAGFGKELSLVVGPEGGWSQRELALFEVRRLKLVTLGPRTLRAETAAIVALALVGHLLGDLSSG
jgi:16S rRNA (uracil1498-N3)-methyltransferase